MHSCSLGDGTVSNGGETLSAGLDTIASGDYASALAG